MATCIEPTVQAMVLCERAYQIERTDEYILVRTLRRLSFREFPARVSCCLYVNLKADHPVGSFVLRLVRLKDDFILFDLPVDFPPLPPHYIQFALTMPELPLEEAGAYSFDLLWGPHMKQLAMWRFEVHPADEGEARE
jgi:hypothetical protein